MGAQGPDQGSRALQSPPEPLSLPSHSPRESPSPLRLGVPLAVPWLVTAPVQAGRAAGATLPWGPGGFGDTARDIHGFHHAARGTARAGRSLVALAMLPPHHPGSAGTGEGGGSAGFCHQWSRGDSPGVPQIPSNAAPPGSHVPPRASLLLQCWCRPCPAVGGFHPQNGLNAPGNAFILPNKVFASKLLQWAGSRHRSQRDEEPQLWFQGCEQCLVIPRDK